MAYPPMGIGLEVDLESGEPVEVARLSRKAQQDEARARTLERHERLRTDLAGQGGEVCQLIAEQLARRIDVLIAEDPEARALRDVLGRVGAAVEYGQRLAQTYLESLAM